MEESFAENQNHQWATKSVLVFNHSFSQISMDS